jgi:hypothetical protein
MAFKIIKKKEFEYTDSTTNQLSTGTHYTVAYKGRVIGVSSLRFEEGELSVDGNTLKIKGELEIRKETNVDQLTGEAQTYLSIYPKMDLQMSAF